MNSLIPWYRVGCGNVTGNTFLTTPDGKFYDILSITHTLTCAKAHCLMCERHTLTQCIILSAYNVECSLNDINDNYNKTLLQVTIFTQLYTSFLWYVFLRFIYCESKLSHVDLEVLLNLHRAWGSRLSSITACWVVYTTKGNKQLAIKIVYTVDPKQLIGHT